MNEKQERDIYFTKLQLIFVVGTYGLIELFLCYNLPLQFDYKYLRITEIGIVSIVVRILPFLLCLLIFWGKLPQLLLSFLLILTMAFGIILPFFYVLYPVTISETKNPQNYLKMDAEVQPEMEYIVKIFPEEIPSDIKRVQYVYRFAEEGMDAGLNLFLAIEWDDESDYLQFKKVLPEVLDGVIGDGLQYKVEYDDLIYKIEYRMKKEQNGKEYYYPTGKLTVFYNNTYYGNLRNQGLIKR